ncbi:MAG: hypothetical protein LBU16_08105 [Treponema sp.]|jgi:hypothetical protein|nr:hypothetical protein [Treponema sp.]
MRKMTLPLLCAALVFSSCVGVSLEIVARQDGSGTIALEYRLSRELEALGKLDGNERWPAVPVGKADFERSAARIEGLSLRSFSEKTAATDVLYRAQFDFATLEALARFLDGAGQRVSLEREGEENRLALSFNHSAGRVEADEALLELVASSFEGYALDFGVTLPQPPQLRIADGRGAPLESPPTGTALVRGNRVSFSAPMADLLSAAEPTLLEIVWRAD